MSSFGMDSNVPSPAGSGTPYLLSPYSILAEIGAYGSHQTHFPATPQDYVVSSPANQELSSGASSVDSARASASEVVQIIRAMCECFENTNKSNNKDHKDAVELLREDYHKTLSQIQQDREHERKTLFAEFASGRSKGHKTPLSSVATAQDAQDVQAQSSNNTLSAPGKAARKQGAPKRPVKFAYIGRKKVGEGSKFDQGIFDYTQFNCSAVGCHVAMASREEIKEHYKTAGHGI